MKQFGLKSASVILIHLFLLFSAGFAADSCSDPTPGPKTNGGKPWRIGYMEGGPYHEYQAILKAFAANLAEAGWIEKHKSPSTSDDKETLAIWSWLASDVRSEYLEFAEDAYWSSEWDSEIHKKNTATAIARFNTKNDIDLMLAFGTWTGSGLANNLHSVPTMIFASSDPVRSEIVTSVEDSGFDHIHARLDPTKYERQIKLFHGIIGFKKLGIAYLDTDDGEAYAGISDIKRVARKIGFETVECVCQREKAYSTAEKQRLVNCHWDIAPRIDAFYLTMQTGVNLKNLPALLEPFFKHQVPTFAQGRTFEVKHGVLMSLAQSDFMSIGKFHADIFSRILNGSKPRDLPQRHEDNQEIALNLETARRIGFHFPIEIVAGASKVYRRIEAEK